MRRVKFEPDTIRTRLREVAFLNSAATIRFRAAPGAAGADGLSIAQSLAAESAAAAAASDEAAEHVSSSGNGNGASSAPAPAAGAAASSPAKGCWEKFHFSGGLEEYVRFNNRDNTPMHDPIYISRTVSYG